MDKFKLQWKFFGFLLGFSGLLLVILWLFQTVWLNDMYKLTRRFEMQQAVREVERALTEDPKAAVALLTTLIEEKEIFVSHTPEFGRFEKPVGDNGSGDNKFFQMRKPEREVLSEKHDFVLEDGKIVTLYFQAIITPVSATVSTLQIQLFLITVIMLLLSAAIAFLTARRVAKPIVDINESAKLLARGHYDTHFAGHGFLEVTELSQTLNAAAAELSKVETLRRELMGNISHDMRTPLALIYSYAEMMQDFPDEVTPQQTQTILDEVQRLTTLVNDVLDISRLESGTMTLWCKEYNITESLKATVERVAELVRSEDYVLRFVSDAPAHICGDEVKITQAFYNLLINAIHYSGEKKEIFIYQKQVEGRLRIEVMDKGEGISAAALPYIWDRYYKENKAHRRAVTGTGIGLSIVKKMVELHGGCYGAESVEGEGSCFWFDLPMEGLEETRLSLDT